MEEGFNEKQAHYVKKLILKRIIHLASEIDLNCTIYLIGSCAYGEATDKSDEDYIILTDKKEKTAKKLKKELKDVLSCKIDCKVVSRTDTTKFMNENYTYVYTMISFGILKFGKPFKIGCSHDSVSQERDKILTKIDVLRARIDEKDNYNILAVELFNLTKRIRHFSRIENPDNGISMKTILGKYLFFLGKIYESMAQTGISTSFERKIKMKQPRKTDYGKLRKIISQIEEKMTYLDYHHSRNLNTPIPRFTLEFVFVILLPSWVDRKKMI